MILKSAGIIDDSLVRSQNVLNFGYILYLVMREKNNEQAVIINNAQQTATFGQMINAATSPIAAAVNVLQNDINSVKCRLPETVTLPANNSVAVPVSGI